MDIEAKTHAVQLAAILVYQPERSSLWRLTAPPPC